MAKESTITLKLETPRFPNFIKVVGIRIDGGGFVGIGDLTEEELLHFAEQWKLDLIEHGRKKRTFLESDNGNS